MAGFFKKLFGGGEPAAPAEPHSYADCLIYPKPHQSAGSWRVGGTITKEINGDVLERIYIRADSFPSESEAFEFSVTKAKQIIDQNGQMLFGDGEKSRHA